MTTIIEQYEQDFAGSRRMWERSRQVISGGITHDGRHILPFPPFMARADGAWKWSVDDQKLIDYGVGHGSLLFGHNDPALRGAMEAQLSRGTHYSAGHELEVAWAEKICEYVPCAELVRFTGSGTESTLIAMRVARGYTQKNTILKFEGHFHGWQDYALKGEKTPFEKTTVAGVPNETLSTVAVVPSNDLAMLEERLAQGDVAGVILEPSGASWTTIPLKAEFLQGVRELTTEYGAVLIFDEVITGFRWARGGAQERFGVTPDLTTFAKIVAGGLPGGACCGKREIMEMIAFHDDDPAFNKDRRVPLAGTFSANPMTAAAGHAMMGKLNEPGLYAQLDAYARQIRAGVNAAIARHDVPGFAWGEASVFHIALGVPCTNHVADDMHTPEGVSEEYLKGSSHTPINMTLEIGCLLEGVHLFHCGGLICAALTQDDVDATIGAIERTIGRLKQEGAFA